MRFARSAVLVIVGLTLGAWWQSSHGARDKEAAELYGTFVDAVEQVQANYVQPVDRKALLESALHGMLSDLDPYSNYMNDDDWRLFQKQIEGSFSGVGVQLDIDRKSGRPIVVAPLVGSPAYENGILAGDLIMEVDGKPTDDWTREKIIENLTGRPGTEVKLTVRHADGEKTETYTLKRQMIELDSVLGDHRKPDDTWDFMLDKERKIGYVRLSAFVEDTAADLDKALDELEGERVAGLVLDLRDNPGGLLSSAVEISDVFLNDGTIVSTRGRATRERTYKAAKDNSRFASPDLPMVVLINGHSASASEIVSAALQDNKRATVVGQRSFGKGSVQNILPLDHGAEHLKLTVATYFRPSQKNIHRFKDAKPEDEWGVKPDEGMEVTVDDQAYVKWARERQRRDMQSKANKPTTGADPLASDVQLAKAVEVIKAKLAEKK
jgi:carboxyl-terminal processing protease